MNSSEKSFNSSIPLEELNVRSVAKVPRVRRAEAHGEPLVSVYKSLQAIDVVTAIWFCSVVAGIVLLARYNSAPGSAAGPPRSWPAIPELPRQSSRPLLVMFVHPQCPCSRASINELARLAARCRDRMDLTALFVVPPGCPPEWHKTTLWENANAIPGLRVITDQDGRLASEFGVTTSGHCLVYDNEEKLIFSGGITTGRGHEGDCLGRAIVIGIARQSTINDGPRECATYGCPLTADQVQSN